MTILKTIALAAALSIPALAAQADSHMSRGTITNIDTKWNKVTIDHGELVNLGMPAMKMVFQLGAPEMIDQLKEGQQLAFVADRVKGKLTVVEIGE